ncbi:MAG: chemotaxis protein CheA [Spirochaetales bacterium]
MKKPSAATAALLRRLRAFRPGDLLESAELTEALEALIVADETSFDDSAMLSKLLEDFTVVVRSEAGVEADARWEALLQTLPAKKSTGRGAPKSTKSAEPTARTLAGSDGLWVDLEVLGSFLSEAREHLEEIEPRILSLESQFSPQTVNEVFRAVHTIKGVSGFLDLDQIKSLSHELEFILDGLRSGKLGISSAVVDLLLQGCDQLQKMVHDVGAQADSMKKEAGLGLLKPTPFDLAPLMQQFQRIQNTAPTGSPEISELLQNPELIAKFGQEAVDTLETVEQCILTMEKTRKTGDYLNEAFRSIHTLKGNAGFFGFAQLESLCMEMESDLDSLRKGQTQIGEDSIQSLLHYLDRLRGLVQTSTVPKPAVREVRVEVAVVPEALAEPPKAETETAKYSVKKKDIRVDTEKLDSLFDLIGELITAEAMVIDSPDLKGLDLEGFSKSAAYLSKITRELQNITMSIRMIPLEGLFSKMNRLVRDLGRKFNKEIELDISGAETEMDRNIIEEISDPLVHIIRNAVDHGIEDTPIRKAKGKNLNGKISLNARYEGNEIWITVSDDGAGLNRERILEVAIERGLLTNGDELTDGEVWKLVFEPGFSTAKEVSEISGRGVGMDVVKKNLEKLRGQIDIQTVTDKGTDFVLKIPLTLAIIDGVTLRCGSMLYSLPIGDVVEFQNFDPEKLTSTDPHHSVMRLRGEILPVMALSDFFQSSSQSTQLASEKQVSIILKSQNRKMAVIVDEIVGYKQIVLKALPEFMAHLKGVSGCTIMGNGEVSLIIDVNALFQRYLD